eukprot:COSAG06_NODE_10167_length_1736_cov_11.358583_2_plen_65_part_00
MIYFYLLCMADPTHPVNAERAQRFAGLFLNEVLKKENGGLSTISISIYTIYIYIYLFEYIYIYI